jgi:hypothetical protein
MLGCEIRANLALIPPNPRQYCPYSVMTCSHIRRGRNICLISLVTSSLPMDFEDFKELLRSCETARLIDRIQSLEHIF